MLLPSDSVLARFTRDLTAEARRGRLDEVYGRESELARLVDILLRRDKNNPVLVGDAGVGKTAVAEALAQLLITERAPLSLRGRRLLALDHMALLGGTMYRGQYEKRMRALVAEIIAAGDVILFIDELHNLIGQGTAVGIAMDAANMLKPALTRGDFRVVGATTAEEYDRWIRPDPALERRFQPVAVRELTSPETTGVLEARRGVLERHHFVVIADDALQASVRLTDLFQPDRRRPDRALDALDEACAHVHASCVYSSIAASLIAELRTTRTAARDESSSAPDSDPLVRFAREGAVALGRLGAELDAAFRVVATDASRDEPRATHGTGSASSLAEDSSAVMTAYAELRDQLLQDGIVVRGNDVARVVSLITGKNVSWVE